MSLGRLGLEAGIAGTNPIESIKQALSYMKDKLKKKQIKRKGFVF
jgi:hypothetical protein